MIHETLATNVYRFQTPNVGDTSSSPTNYFQLGRIIKVDILNPSFLDRIRVRLPLILGGGGIFWFSDRVERIARQHKGPMIAWGVGDNRHERKKTEFPTCLDDFDLVGVRDFGTKFPWVPCTSCMHALFDEHYTIKREMGIYQHYDIPITHDKTALSNNATFESVINFLGESEVVATNSYHGAYWATLLGRKTIVVRPHSSKFYGFRHKPLLLNEVPKSWKNVIDRATTYPESLSECRAANSQFCNKVKELLQHSH